MEVLFRVNGTVGAFSRELGCQGCPQCSAVKPRAATSGSLLIKDGRRIECHVLFDCGAGVVDSLIDFGVDRVDVIFNSHRHLDHIADFDRLLNSLKRTRHQFIPPVFYAMAETWRRGVGWSYPWLAGLVRQEDLDPYVVFNPDAGGRSPVDPGAKLNPPKAGLGVNLKVTPVPVYHGPWVPVPVVFVVEFGQGDSYRKIILMWDWLHLVTAHPTPQPVGPVPSGSHVPSTIEDPPGSCGYPTDDCIPKLYPNLSNPAQNIGSADLLPEHEILRGAHELFIAGNTRFPRPTTGHASIEAGMKLIQRIKPNRSWVVHYSGHEDAGGPLSDRQLQDWLKQTSGVQLAGHSIQVAQHGMTLTWAV